MVKRRAYFPSRWLVLEIKMGFNCTYDVCNFQFPNQQNRNVYVHTCFVWEPNCHLAHSTKAKLGKWFNETRSDPTRTAHCWIKWIRFHFQFIKTVNSLKKSITGHRFSQRAIICPKQLQLWFGNWAPPPTDSSVLTTLSPLGKVQVILPLSLWNLLPWGWGGRREEAKNHKVLYI